jgi:hypothetical protein
MLSFLFDCSFPHFSLYAQIIPNNKEHGCFTYHSSSPFFDTHSMMKAKDAEPDNMAQGPFERRHDVDTISTHLSDQAQSMSDESNITRKEKQKNPSSGLCDEKQLDSSTPLSPYPANAGDKGHKNNKQTFKEKKKVKKRNKKKTKSKRKQKMPTTKKMKEKATDKDRDKISPKGSKKKGPSSSSKDELPPLLKRSSWPLTTDLEPTTDPRVIQSARHSITHRQRRLRSLLCLPITRSSQVDTGSILHRSLPF